MTNFPGIKPRKLSLQIELTKNSFLDVMWKWEPTHNLRKNSIMLNSAAHANELA